MALANSKSRGGSSALSAREVLLEEYRKKLGNTQAEVTPNGDNKKSTLTAEQELTSAYQKNAQKQNADKSTVLMNERKAQTEILNYGKAMAGLNAKSSTENYKKYNEAKSALTNKGYTEDEINQSANLARQLVEEDSKKNTQEFAKKHPFISSALSLGSNLMTPAETLENVGYYLDGKSDVKQSNNFASELTQNLRQGASSDMGKVGNFAYNNVLMPILDNATAMLAGGGFKGSQIVGAGQAADSAYDKAKENGNSTERALATAGVVAASSYLTDAFSLGNLEKMKATGNVGLKNAVKDIGKQVAVEGSEEATDELLNQIADLLINRENSQQAIDYNVYRESGLSEKDAKQQVAKDSLKQIGLSGLAGGISGGVMGGGMTAYNNIVNRSGRNTMAELDPLNAFGLNDVVQNADSNASGAVGEAVYGMMETTSHMDSKAITEPLNQNNATESEAYKRSRKQSIIKQIDNIFRGNTHPDTFVQIGATPTILKKYGAPNLNMNMSQNTMFKIAYPEGYNGRKHNLGFDAVAELPYQLADPIAILKSDTEKNSFVVVTEYLDERNYPIITAVHLNKNGVIEPANQIASMYGKRDFDNWVKGQKEKGNVLYENKNKGLESIALAGLQLPSLYSEADPLFNNSIYDSVKNINKEININDSHPTRPDVDSPQALRLERSAGKAEPYRVPNASGTPDPAANVRNVHELSSNNNIPNSADNVNAEVGNQRVRGYNDTLVNKTDAPQELKKEFINNPDMYTQLSNAKTLAKAVEILENNSIDAAIAQYRSLLDKKNPVSVPLGYNISKQLSQAGRLDESVQIVREMSRALTESGQFSQAAAITMLNNDPEAAKRYLIREIDTLNQKGAEKFGKKWTDFELTESELQEFNGIESGDSEAIKTLYDKVYKRLRKEYPSTMAEKLMEFRRISMLLNVRTNVRNIVSNALLFPVRWTSDRVSALGEGVYSLINPKYERTQSLNPIRSKQAKQLASEAFKTVESELLGENKYEDAKGAMRDKQVFKGGKTAQMLDTLTNGAITKVNRAMDKEVDPSLMETARNFTYWLLEKGDNIFVQKNFESRMASYIAAQGITDLESIPADAYVLATQEALKATFKDDSALANGLSAFRQMLNAAPGGMLGDVVMPFTKTPANLAMRGIDYSPAGVYNGLMTLQNAKSNADIAKGITQLGQAATGTAAILLGYALAEAGWITGALSDDKDEAQFQKQQGQLAYSVKTPYGYLTYDWAQPASIPLILGVTIYDSWNNEQDFVEGLKQGTLAAVDSWLELSPLQNLSDIFGGYGTPAENVWDVIANDFPLSFLPAQMGAMAKVGDTTQRVTYDNTSDWNSFLNQAKAKIPGLSEELPVAYDTWGNPIQRQDSIGEAAFANLLNPGQFGNENVTPIDDEINALYEATNDASVFPRKAKWTEDDMKLDNEQYSEFQRIMGENAYNMASAFINSASYSTIDDELKVKAIGEMYSFAHALAKSSVAGYDVENSQTYKKAYSVYAEKGVEGVATYYAITANKNGQSNLDMVNAVNTLDISDEDKGYYLAVLKGELSKEAQVAYDASGYAGVYWHYMDKTGASAAGGNIEETEQSNAGASDDPIARIAALRKQSTSGVSADAVARIRAMHEGTQPQVTPEMIAKITALRG